MDRINELNHIINEWGYIPSEHGIAKEISQTIFEDCYNELEKSAKWVEQETAGKIKKNEVLDILYPKGIQKEIDNRIEKLLKKKKMI